MYACNKGLRLSGELIVRSYVAESITTDAGHFGRVGLCQLRTKTQSCISCYWLCYVSAHDQFARYQQHSNEPLRHHLHLCRCCPDCYIYLFSGTKGYSWASAIQHLLTLTKACVQTLTHFLLLNCVLAQCQHLWYNSIKTVIFQCGISSNHIQLGHTTNPYNLLKQYMHQTWGDKHIPTACAGNVIIEHSLKQHPNMLSVRAKRRSDVTMTTPAVNAWHCTIHTWLRAAPTEYHCNALKESIIDHTVIFLTTDARVRKYTLMMSVKCS